MYDDFLSPPESQPLGVWMKVGGWDEKWAWGVAATGRDCVKGWMDAAVACGHWRARFGSWQRQCLDRRSGQRGRWIRCLQLPSFLPLAPFHSPAFQIFSVPLPTKFRVLFMIIPYLLQNKIRVQCEYLGSTKLTASQAFGYCNSVHSSVKQGHCSIPKCSAFLPGFGRLLSSTS